MGNPNRRNRVAGRHDGSMLWLPEFGSDDPLAVPHTVSAASFPFALMRKREPRPSTTQSIRSILFALWIEKRSNRCRAQPHAVRLKAVAMPMATMTCALWLITTSQVDLHWRVHRVLEISLIADGSCNGTNPNLSVKNALIGRASGPAVVQRVC
jgi:hypothetical protein